METFERTLSVNQVVTREIRSAMSREGVTQKELAKAMQLSPGSVSLKLRGEVSFSLTELLSIAGILNLSLEELLGSSIITSKVPAPTYTEDEKGKKKVVPVGFVPTGTTYQMVSPLRELVPVGPAGLEPATKGL